MKDRGRYGHKRGYNVKEGKVGGTRREREEMIFNLADIDNTFLL
jgi:hypothetical protein